MPFLTIHSRETSCFFECPAFQLMLSGSSFWCDNKQPEVLLGILFSSRLKEWRKKYTPKQKLPLCPWNVTNNHTQLQRLDSVLLLLLTNDVRKTFKHLQPPTLFVNPKEETWAKKKKAGKKQPWVSEIESSRIIVFRQFVLLWTIKVFQSIQQQQSN